MRKPLWVPSDEWKGRANITRFMRAAAERYGLEFAGYGDLYAWSVRNLPDFWAAVWDFVGMKASRTYDEVVRGIERFPGAEWFPGARPQFRRKPAEVSGRTSGRCLSGRGRKIGVHDLCRTLRRGGPPLPGASRRRDRARRPHRRLHAQPCGNRGGDAGHHEHRRGVVLLRARNSGPGQSQTVSGRLAPGSFSLWTARYTRGRPSGSSTAWKRSPGRFRPWKRSWWCLSSMSGRRSVI